jgi:hypothetical protein
MTIQRQYSLPNCRLILEGLSNETTDMSGRPLLSMVTNVECHLAGQKEPLRGGRAFLDSLAIAVSSYAQSYLSSIQHLVRRDRQNSSSLVQIEQVESNLHRLTVHSEAGPGIASEVDLTTVQLFDLVEAIDQCFADAQTLPDLTLKLEPLSKRHVVASEPISKRAVPAAIGLSGLAAAAAVLFMLPAPQVRRPEIDAATQTTPGQTTPSPASPKPSAASPTPSPASTSSPATPSPAASAPASPSPVSPSPTSAASSPSATASATLTPTSSPTNSPEAQGAGLNLTSVPEIKDSAELDRLTVQLYDKLDLGWKKKPSFDGELVYRVGVDQGGNIVGYKYTNNAALTYLNDTPLSEVQFSTPEASTASPAASSPIAQFRVVFKSNGVLEVSPWNGQRKSVTSPNSPEPKPSASASP